MLSKAKYWMGIGKPKNQHSLENLKYLFAILNKNQIVTENNKDLLIETLRSISEILIWGDQNDSSVFDFFLEKQMITFFLQYMKQKYGRYICVQLLQTLNILFENIRNETSLYFLLSNNHINNIILNKFDFSDEEVMAYYISFLKTLSLKLNSHSIHFFFNERASEFPLYVEALKFFDHPEAMVRIAVRTLTLNIFRVPVQSMQKFVKEKTAVCYFSNLVWLIRNHVLDLDACVKNTIDHTKKCRLIDLIDEYIDHLSYIQDIYKLNIQSLSNILSEQLIRRLFVPVYLSSILHKEKFVLKDRRPIITPIVATFLLSHVFSIIEYAPLLSDLCELIFGVQEEKVFDQMCSKTSSGIDYLGEPVPLLQYLSSLNQSSSGSSRSGKSSSGSSKSKTRSHSVPHFNQLKSTATSLSSSSTDNNGGANTAEGGTSSSAEDQTTSQVEFGSTTLAQASSHSDSNSLDNRSTHSSEQQPSAAIATSDMTGDEEATPTPIIDLLSPIESVQQQSFFIGPISDSAAAATSSQLDPFENITDDDKRRMNMASTSTGITSKSTQNGVIFESLLQFLNVQDYDEMNALIALSFFYTLMNNPGLPSKYLELVKVKLNKTNEVLSSYDDKLMSKLIGIVSKSVESDFRVRLSTLDLTIKLIKTMTILNRKCYISDFHLACIEQAREQSSFILRRHFKSEEMFLDMFEHEYNELNMQQHQFDSVLRDWSILLPPTSTPLSLIEFTRRFPCGDTEKLKQNIRTFFYLRDLCLSLTGEFENQLPLTKQEHLVKENNALDLNSSDLIACTVNLKDKKDRRFLVIDPIQFILVEPEVKRIGWGIVKFSDLIQDVEVSPDKEDSRSLNITIKKTNLNGKPEVVLNSIFTFDDHIRCMAAKQHLIRARDRARRIKLEKIAQLLDIASCSNNNQSNKSVNSTSPSNPASAADILSYNLVAGFNMFNTINPPGRASMIMRTVSGFNSSAPTLYRPPNGPSQFVASPLPSLSHSQSSPSSAQKDAVANNSISTITQVDDSSSQFSNTNDQVMMTPMSIPPTSPRDVSLVNNDTPSSSSPSPTSPHKSRDSPSTPKTPKSATRLGDEFIA